MVNTPKIALPGLAWIILILVLNLPEPVLGAGYRIAELKGFQGRIVDYSRRLNPRFTKKARKETRLVVVHTSELGLDATLRVVSQGKQFKSGYRTPGGHAHYVIARNGRTYRIMNHRFRADHAGRSMWNGRTDVSGISVGIELVGYHYAPITTAQYRSCGLLIHILKKVYRLSDKDVVTHSQVAYGRPNPWFPKNHRGRKRCAKNFDRARAGLGPTWSYDPDVRAGRLMSDPILAKVFYGRGTTPGTPAKAAVASNIISKENTAWAVAGDDYNADTTVYILPDGRMLTGSRIGAKIGWGWVPAGTRVLLDQALDQEETTVKGPIRTISGTMTAWSHAGAQYRAGATIYFLPTGRIAPGSAIADWDDLPAGTRLIVGYKGPFAITRDRTAYKIAGARYKSRRVVYHLPGGQLLTGDQVHDFSDLPKGVSLYLPL